MANKGSQLFPEDGVEYDLSLWQELTFRGKFWNELKRASLLNSLAYFKEGMAYFKEGMEKWKIFFIEQRKADYSYIQEQWDTAMWILELAELFGKSAGYVEGALESEIVHWLSNGCARSSKNSETIRVLIVDKSGKRGITGKLTLGCIPQGRGEIYRSPDVNAFLGLREWEYWHLNTTGNEYLFAWQIYSEKASIQNIPDIVEFLKKEEPPDMVFHVIMQRGLRGMLPDVFPLLYRSKTVNNAYHVVRTLGTDKDICGHIAPLLKEKNWELRRYGCWLIRDLGTLEHIPLVLPFIEDEYQLVRYSAYEALDVLTKTFMR